MADFNPALYRERTFAVRRLVSFNDVAQVGHEVRLG